MITEDYVSFETAKLLKEKRFDAYCTKFYNNLNQDRTFELYNAQQLKRASVVSNKILDDYLPTLQVKSTGYAAPTLQMAMKWLREVHKKNINIIYDLQEFQKTDGTDGSVEDVEVYEVDIITKNGTFYIGNYNHYESAAEAAIKYCLENLI